MTNDLGTRIERACEPLDAHWDPEHVEVALAGMHRKRRRRVAARLAAGVVIAAAGGVAALLAVPLSSDRPAPAIAAREAPAAEPAAGRVLYFPEGSRAIVLTNEGRLVVEAVAADAIAVTLAQGAAQFEVTKNAGRVFRVTAGPATIEVIGTSFTVERGVTRAGVVVHEGRVRFTCRGEQLDVDAGATRWCAVDAEAVDDRHGPPRHESVATVRRGAPSQPAVGVNGDGNGLHERRSTWRSLAEQGAFAQAYEVQRDTVEVVLDEPEDLLLAADVARLSGHSDQALEPLDRLIARYPDNPQAPLAAFTLGRVLLTELGRPREAASAFARARALAPQGSLAQDALAREVEAWFRAGETDLAHDRALEYLGQFPDGRRVRAVREYGGID